jgi:hypothetical protein
MFYGLSLVFAPQGIFAGKGLRKRKVSPRP